MTFLQEFTKYLNQNTCLVATGDSPRRLRSGPVQFLDDHRAGKSRVIGYLNTKKAAGADRYTLGRVIVFDIDDHERRLSFEDLLAHAARLSAVLTDLDIPHLVWTSQSGHGFHVVIVLDQDATSQGRRDAAAGILQVLNERLQSDGVDGQFFPEGQRHAKFAFKQFAEDEAASFGIDILPAGDGLTGVSLPFWGESYLCDTANGLARHADPESCTIALVEHAKLKPYVKAGAAMRGQGAGQRGSQGVTAPSDERPAGTLRYKTPASALGRNAWLTSAAGSMWANGAERAEMAAELHRLNRECAFAGTSGVAGATSLPDGDVDRIVESISRYARGVASMAMQDQLHGVNNRFALVTTSSGKVEYLNEQMTTQQGHLVTHSEADLGRLLATEKVEINDKQYPILSVWRQWPLQRRYSGYVIEPECYNGPGYNLWRGYPIEQGYGDPIYFRRYLSDVLCRNDAGLLNWLTQWLADAVQRPTENSCQTAVIMRGPPGGGKSLLYERILRTVLGSARVQVVADSKRVRSTFNRAWFGATFVVFEESTFAGDYNTAQMLKAMITREEWEYEQKHAASFMGKNVSRVIILTNEQSAVPLDVRDRRYTVIEVTSDFDRDTEEGQRAATEFWRPYLDEARKQSGDILNYLMNVKVNLDLIRYPYITDAKGSDRLLGNPVLAVLHDICERGVVPDDDIGEGILSNKTLKREAVELGLSPRQSSEAVVKLAREILGDACVAAPSRKARFFERLHAYRETDTQVTQTDPIMHTRQRGIELKSLAEVREQVSQWTKVTYGSAQEDEDRRVSELVGGHAAGSWGCWVPPSARSAGPEHGNGKDVPF